MTTTETIGQLMLVGVGGGVGTGLRFLLEDSFPPAAGGVPWTTLLINVVGSFLLGLLLEFLAGHGADSGRGRGWRLGCGTGLIGGFTTYSTFILEIDGLWRGGGFGAAALYLILSVCIGLIAAGAGLAAGSRIRSRDGWRS